MSQNLHASGTADKMSAIRDIALAWVFSLPAAAILSGSLFWLFHRIAK